MATVPSGYVSLGTVGFTDKGDYSSSETYYINDLVHYNTAIYRCLVDDTTGKTPTNTSYWTKWLASGDSADGITITDTAGVLGTANASTDLQSLVDGITSHVANNLTTTSSGYVLDARQGKTLNDNKAPKASPTFSGTIYHSGFGSSTTSYNQLINLNTSTLKMFVGNTHTPSDVQLECASGTWSLLNNMHNGHQQNASLSDITVGTTWTRAAAITLDYTGRYLYYVLAGSVPPNTIAIAITKSPSTTSAMTDDSWLTSTNYLGICIGETAFSAGDVISVWLAGLSGSVTLSGGSNKNHFHIILLGPSGA